MSDVYEVWGESLDQVLSFGVVRCLTLEKAKAEVSSLKKCLPENNYWYQSQEVEDESPDPLEV